MKRRQVIALWSSLAGVRGFGMAAAERPPISKESTRSEVSGCAREEEPAAVKPPGPRTAAIRSRALPPGSGT
jgi:hypothetical protein